MKSYFVSFVVLLLVVSYNVGLSSKNDTSIARSKVSSRDSKDSQEKVDSMASSSPTDSKAEVLLDAISTATFRNVRLNSSTSSAHERDTKLMNLLASRRSALHHDRFKTHSRTASTGRTRLSTEATSKSPPDSRSVCVRNCTKNFTRRTTASCMRQCNSIQRFSNATNVLTKNNTSEEEKPQKDNNEILFTDESSHGFFVVAKDVNDTMNHISELGKNPGTLSGGVFKPRPRKRPYSSLHAANSDSESDSYMYFGRKIPSLRPSFLSISTVSDDHPQVFEVSVSHKPPPSKSSDKLVSRDRLPSAFTRKFNAGKLTPLVSQRSTAVTEQAPLQNDQTLVPSSPQNKSSEVKTTEAEVHSLKITADSPPLTEVTLPIEETTEGTFVEDKPRAVIISSTDVSTPLLISVIDEDETTVVPDLENNTNPTTLDIEDARTDLAKIEAPSHLSEDKTNLIVFVNKSRNAVTSPTIHNITEPTESMTFVKTSIVSSVRSTVHPPLVTSNTLDTTSTEQNSQSSYAAEEGIVEKTSSVYETTVRSVKELTDQRKSRLPEESDLTRLNIATYMLAGLGLLPVLVVIVYLGKSLIWKGYLKHDEDFDVCITDQKPISPVKKIEEYDDEERSGICEQCSISSTDEFNRANLRLKSLLGEGNFGKVWKAEADDLCGHMGATRIVAVKTVRLGSPQNGLRDEANIMRKLGSHPNVVTLLGACLESEPQMLIMEFAMRGRLLSLLRAARSATNILPASVPGGKSLAPLSPRTLAGFALDIATGMEYIAENKIVHRDLAARNILIDHNGICKICDFGMSTDLDVAIKNHDTQFDMKNMRSNTSKLDKFKFDLGERFINNWNQGFGNHNTKKHNDTSTIGRRPALPIRWMAPEALQFNKFSIETDVWAFGIVLWEIATLGATPYSNLSGREVIQHVLQGTKPELPKDGRHGFFELMLQCWHMEPALRPTFHEARSEISRSVCKWLDEDAATSDYMDVSGFSEDLEHGMVYFNQRISEFECEI